MSCHSLHFIILHILYLSKAHPQQIFPFRIKKEKTPEGKLKKYGEAVQSLSGISRAFFHQSKRLLGDVYTYKSRSGLDWL